MPAATRATPDPAAKPAQTALSPLRRRGLDWVLGGLLLAGLLIWVHATVGWPQLLAPWLDMRPLTLAGLVLLGAASYVLRAIRAYDYLHERVAGHFPAILRLSTLHNVANNLLPMRLGEAAFPLLLWRHFGLRVTDSTLTLIWIRVLDLHVLGSIAGVALILGTGGSAVAYLVFVAWIAGLPVGLKLLPLLGRSGRGGWVGRAIAATTRASPPWGLRLARLYLWTALSWGAKVLAFGAITAHFLDAPPAAVIGGVVGAELSSVLPFHGVAGAGTYEAAMVAALYPLGVAPADALKAAVNLHIFLLGLTVFLGAAALALPAGPRRVDGVGSAARVGTDD
jgi:uncharacterized membrane protein YbhN (UPF0104 family)